MTESNANASPRQWPLLQLVLARLREFFREPAAVFWVYGFPLLLAVLLSLAFRNRADESITVDLIDSPHAAAVVSILQADRRFNVTTGDEDETMKRLRRAKTDLVIRVTAPAQNGLPPVYEYWLEPSRTESLNARNAADAVLARAISPTSMPHVEEHSFDQVGSRYIDFLIPGLLGMNLMGGGLWGVGFVLVDLRIRKLLKRFLATPMQRRDLLLSLMIARLLFIIPEVGILLGFASLVLGVPLGSLLNLAVMIVVGAAAFSGIGLLVSSRAKTIETISGLMNLVMLPMWLLSGVFFSSERFPEVVQPVIQLLPLTALINGLRGIMLDDLTLWDVRLEVVKLLVWGIVTFVIALRIFRWK
ncbi:ABC transporter permease [Tuwongella immobilis]|uniref:Transport permease protein n=1 Tax=Tuwongella immobilis TaxID=692036 RepID=A0A6C2YIQ1_9BACT|nr:ABC transporter permease [Tuwongella immobilis]VIP01013.1 abc-2 family transporter protein : ABC-type multidrug transport system, permease component OS=Singulisphaera acidiphila (strain ATCC BAA-1392 / DSM 18658 / VKM B-2454 / MOB10) GN=Sinac_1473 PE=4 SV=1: ABC2_membrane_3 [Tuwongella immobilis]VTR97450.1 abc-2 family transporter protein : ABC-type multidrug transport system, permease component OS=Singulisphaera acidiphila (strain ATCC BAA-1392 / DSM 18658 / VKM B-2454 / MOB10) GN=Sinac_1473 